MNRFDDEIRDALRAESDAPDMRIETIREMLGESFRHRARGVGRLVLAKGLLMGAGMVFAAVMFFRVETTRALVGYATLFLYCGLGVMLLWAVYWLLLNRNATARELKRLELRLTELAQRLGQ